MNNKLNDAQKGIIVNDEKVNQPDVGSEKGMSIRGSVKVWITDNITGKKE